MAARSSVGIAGIRRTALLSCCLLGAGLTACSSGRYADEGEEPEAPGGMLDEPGVPSPECAPDAPSEADRLRRLTMTQYRNTIRDFVGWVLGDPTEAANVIAMAALDDLPSDRREPVPQDPHGSYRRLDQSLEQVHVDGPYRVGTILGAELTRPARLGIVVGPCAVDTDPTNDAPCLTDFIARFGERALRHPLSSEELSFYSSVYGTDSRAQPEAYADVISVMLNAPHFLYFVEHGGREAPGEPGTYELSSHELATRLSYHFWQTMPDEELWQTARDDSILDADVYANQVRRLAEDPRARETMSEFFGDWLKVEDLPRLDDLNDSALYASFAGPDLPGPNLREYMIDEVLNMTDYYTWTGASVQDLFTSELSFARSEGLAAIYGVAPWDGVSKPPRMPAGQRPGILTRALFLATGTANTRPIRKGVFIRKHVLCDEIAPPPANANAVLPELRSDMTTRQVVEELTEQPGSVCAACHATLINPLGFALEGFDALGRFRTEQRLFDEAGTVVGSLPVDTRTVPRVTGEDAASSNGPSDLVTMIRNSGKLETCLARNYFRFTFGRWEDLPRDKCTVERLRARLVESGRIVDMLAEVALTPEFRQRSFD